MKVRNNSDESSNLFRRLTSSYVSRKAWLLHNKNFTQSVVSIFEEEPNEIDMETKDEKNDDDSDADDFVERADFLNTTL